MRKRSRRPEPGRNVALGIVAATLSMAAGVVVASVTIASINPLYRFGPAPPARETRLVAPQPTRPPAIAFVPIRWPGFAAVPPVRADGYDDPALLAEPRPRRASAPDFKLPPPEPVSAPEPASTPAVDPLDLPPPITPAEIGEGPPLP